MRVVVDDLDAGAGLLRRARLEVERVGDSLRVGIAPSSAAEVTRLLAAGDQWVTELRPDRLGLEDVFLELTTGDLDDGTAPDAGRARDAGPTDADRQEVVA